MILPNPTTSFGRRRFLGSVAGLTGAALLVACGKDDPAAGDSTAGTTATTGAAAATTAATATTAAGAVLDGTPTPSETGGPFPADGSNDNGEGTIANVLADGRSVRSDIRADLDGSNVQPGVPFELDVTVVDIAGAPLAGAAFYIWHCNRDGEYSEYNSPMLGGDFTDRSFLRGVQVTDTNGTASFSTILPGRYQGRAFHIHFEVYEDGTYAKRLLTSQMAMDDAQIDALYEQADGYATALRNETTNARDGVFSDGVDHQLLTVTGDVTNGLTATFTAVVA
ncbi:MAG: hypothetical protein KDB06_08335 [Ilumatobacter sp.]|nr:hypothetical protein [Ilumatobacter sp.]MCB0984646.1 hypothetical protein [Ilumatobacter sp.]